MKDKIVDFLKVFLLMFSMVMGFFFIYAFAWFALDLPVTQWAMLLLLALALLSEYGYYRWIRVEAHEETEPYDTHWSNERAYKNGYAKGVKEFAEKLHTEISAARDSNFKAKNERIEKYGAEDSFTMYCDGKIHALDGIDYFADNLVKEMVGADNATK